MRHTTKRQIAKETFSDILSLISHNQLAVQLKNEYQNAQIDKAVTAGWEPFSIRTAIELWIEHSSVHEVPDPEIGLQLIDAFRRGAVNKLVQCIYEIDAENFLLEKEALTANN